MQCLSRNFRASERETRNGLDLARINTRRFQHGQQALLGKPLTGLGSKCLLLGKLFTLPAQALISLSSKCLLLGKLFTLPAQALISLSSKGLLLGLPLIGFAGNRVLLGKALAFPAYPFPFLFRPFAGFAFPSGA